MNDGITVVIPAYNASLYLDETIQSILDQTVQPAEIIVVDDCSTDDTAAHAAAFGAPVRVLRSAKNRASSGGPRNMGIDAARTRYVQVFDADDLMYPRMLERLGDAMRACPQAGAAFCQIEKFASHGGSAPPYTMRDMHFRKLMRRKAENIHLLQQQEILDSLMHEYCLATGALLFSKDAWKRAGGYCEELRWAEDLDFGFKLAQRESFAFVDEVLYGYRVHASSKSAQRGEHYRVNIERIWWHLQHSHVSPSARTAARRRIAELEVDLAWFFSNVPNTHEAMRHWWKAIRAVGMTPRMRSHCRKLARHLLARSYKRIAKQAA